MTFDLVDIVRKMGPFQLAVAITLLVMAIAAVAVAVERTVVLYLARARSTAFAAAAGKLIAERDLRGLVKQVGPNPTSPLASLLGGGAKAYLAADGSEGDVTPAELARREMARRTETIDAEARRGLSILASVGSVGPFVGLLGTVVGIIAAFQGIAQESSGGLKAVQVGIAEALVVTAFGLLVAIPSVLVFNFLTGRADALLRACDQARGEFADRLEVVRPAKQKSERDAA